MASDELAAVRVDDAGADEDSAVLLTGETVWDEPVSGVTSTIAPSAEYLVANTDDGEQTRRMRQDRKRDLDEMASGLTIGRLQVASAIGSGGMGQVVEAKDESLLRSVAIKVMHRDSSENHELRRRFLAEAQITAQLEHPSIVPIYDVGTTSDNRPYIVLKKIEGRSLRTVLDELLAGDQETAQEWTRHKLLGAFLQVVNAVAYAHDRRVLHRDLKPENIMLGAFGEVLVLDWGVAGRIEKDGVADAVGGTGSDSGVRHVSIAAMVDGTVIGTPGYMSPEQCRGELSTMDPRSDVWSLGAILYEILTLQPAYEGYSPVDLMVSTLDGLPPHPDERVAEGLPRVLSELCLRALAPDRDERVRTALELARSIEEHLEGTRRSEEAQRWVSDAQIVWAQFIRLGEHRAMMAIREKRLSDAANSWSPLSEKKSLIEVRDAIEALEPRRARVFGEFVSLCEKALAHDPGNVDARAALADGYWQRLEEAETRRDLADVVYFADRVAAYDNGRYASLLEGTGTVTLQTTPSGAAVTCERFDERGIVRPLVDEESWGTTPIRARELPMGSYRLTISHPDVGDTIYPVFISRSRRWDSGRTPVPLYSSDAIGAGFVYVPSGPMITGGDRDAPGSLPRATKYVRSFFIATHPVTMEEYLAFLNDLHQSDPTEAWRRVPRSEASLEESHGQYFTRPRPDAHYELPDVDRDGAPWDPLWPVFGVSWHDAVAYCDWASARDGVRYHLPLEVEFEKAARGVDGRFYPWGDAFDRTLCKMGDSRRGRPRPEMIGAFSGDVSVYGARDIAGSMRDWCGDEEFNGDATLRPVRGGSWNYDPRFCRAACRLGRAPWRVFSYNGFRLARYDPLGPSADESG